MLLCAQHTYNLWQLCATLWWLWGGLCAHPGLKLHTRALNGTARVLNSTARVLNCTQGAHWNGTARALNGTARALKPTAFGPEG